MSAAQTANWPISDDLANALAADDRETCWAHQCWAKDCVDHPMHSDPHGYARRELNRLVTS